MNADAERKKSFGEPITELFQKQYASAVIDLERLNADLQRYLTSMQALCFEVTFHSIVKIHDLLGIKLY